MLYFSSSPLPSCSLLLLLLLSWRIDDSKAWMPMVPTLVGYGHQPTTRTSTIQSGNTHCFRTSGRHEPAAPVSSCWSLAIGRSSGTTPEKNTPPAAAVSRNISTNHSSSSPSLSPHLIFPGGGILFYWMAGVVTHLRDQNYNLDTIPLSGASAGALAATLTATGVDFYRATELALDLAQRAGVGIGVRDCRAYGEISFTSGWTNCSHPKRRI